MKKTLLALAAAALLAGPAVARAGFMLEGSVGSGVRTSPTPVERIPTNVMLAPGYSLAGILRLQLGVLGNMSDAKNSKFELDLRPMVTVSPPLFPLYLRGVFAVTNLNRSPVKYQYGGALGLRIGVLGVGGFVEAGYVPRIVQISTPTGTTDKTYKIVEGRVGVYWD